MSQHFLIRLFKSFFKKKSAKQKDDLQHNLIEIFQNNFSTFIGSLNGENIEKQLVMLLLKGK